MASRNQYMNMSSGSTTRPVSRLVDEFTRSNKLTGTSKKHSDSKVDYTSDESSFSQDFNDIGGRGARAINKVSKRLGKEVFPSNGIKAKVLFGDIYSDENDVDITWNRSPQDVILVWSVNCNLDGEEGISCDGKGFAGWDEKYGCYLPYNRSIMQSEDCMKIIELKDSPAPAPKTAEKPTTASYTNDSDDSDCGEETCPTCPYINTRGKQKGKPCGKSCEEDSQFCKKHAKKAAKQDAIKVGDTNPNKASKGNQSKPVSDTSTEVKDAADEVEAEDEVEVEVEVEAEAEDEVEVEAEAEDEVEVEAEVDMTCIHMFSRATKTASKGDLCGKPAVKDGKCSTHSKTKAKKEIDISDEGGDDKAKMTETFDIKNIMEALTASLKEILSGAIKSTHLANAIASIESDEAQAVISKIIQDNIPKITKSKSIRKTKPKKDPAAPKRPLSSYMFFCKVDRPMVKAANPTMKAVDISREMGKNWSSLSEKKKEPYIKQAEADKVRYSEDMINYQPSDEWKEIASQQALDKPAKGKGKGKGKSVKTRKAGPKRGLSAYMFFCKERREHVKYHNQDFDAKEVTRELGRQWREELNDDEKAPFLALAEQDKSRFEEEKANWVEPEPDSESEEKEKVAPKAKKSKSKSKSKKVESDSEEKEEKVEDDVPINKGTDGFSAFCLQHRPQVKKSNPKWPVSRVITELTKMWSVMDDQEKSEY